jgi:predicted lipoprotein with Yx(FWY)xxD motif
MLKFVRAGVVLSAAALGMLGVHAATLEPAKMGDTSKGRALVDGKGMTLYTFENDVAGKSGCNSQCADVWPPFRPAADSTAAGDWTIIVRDDGSKQWAYKGKALYFWTNDKKPGDATGDGVNGFHIAM